MTKVYINTEDLLSDNFSKAYIDFKRKKKQEEEESLQDILERSVKQFQEDLDKIFKGEDSETHNEEPDQNPVD